MAAAGFVLVLVCVAIAWLRRRRSVAFACWLAALLRADRSRRRPDAVGAPDRRRPLHVSARMGLALAAGFAAPRYVRGRPRRGGGSPPPAPSSSCWPRSRSASSGIGATPRRSGPRGRGLPRKPDRQLQPRAPLLPRAAAGLRPRRSALPRRDRGRRHVRRGARRTRFPAPVRRPQERGSRGPRRALAHEVEASETSHARARQHAAMGAREEGRSPCDVDRIVEQDPPTRRPSASSPARRRRPAGRRTRSRRSSAGSASNPGDPLGDLAWLLATNPDDAARDGKRALALAQKEAPKGEVSMRLHEHHGGRVRGGGGVRAGIARRRVGPRELPPDREPALRRLLGQLEQRKPIRDAPRFP